MNEQPASPSEDRAHAPTWPRYEPPSVQAQRQRRSEKLLLLVARLLFLVLLVTVTVLTIASQREESPEEG